MDSRPEVKRRSSSHSHGGKRRRRRRRKGTVARPTTRVPITELNPHLACVLCGGYYIDATTIIECLHSFCKTCIVRYLETSNYCPICDVQVHKTRPFLNIRPDHTLQDLVYKLVPGLFTGEMRKRRDFYASHPAADTSTGTGDNANVTDRDRLIYATEEKISVAFEFSPDAKPVPLGKERTLPVSPATPGGSKVKEEKMIDKGPSRRYLLCPAAFTIGHLKKFVRMKFGLSPKYEVDVFHTEEGLSSQYTLMDVAYIYSWHRNGPLRLFYTIYEPQEVTPLKRRKLNESTVEVTQKVKSHNNLAHKSRPDAKKGTPHKASGGVTKPVAGDNVGKVMAGPSTSTMEPPVCGVKPGEGPPGDKDKTRITSKDDSRVNQQIPGKQITDVTAKNKPEIGKQAAPRPLLKQPESPSSSKKVNKDSKQGSVHGSRPVPQQHVSDGGNVSKNPAPTPVRVEGPAEGQSGGVGQAPQAAQTKQTTPTPTLVKHQAQSVNMKHPAPVPPRPTASHSTATKSPVTKTPPQSPIPIRPYPPSELRPGGQGQSKSPLGFHAKPATPRGHTHAQKQPHIRPITQVHTQTQASPRPQAQGSKYSHLSRTPQPIRAKQQVATMPTMKVQQQSVPTQMRIYTQPAPSLQSPSSAQTDGKPQGQGLGQGQGQSQGHKQPQSPSPAQSPAQVRTPAQPGGGRKQGVLQQDPQHPARTQHHQQQQPQQQQQQPQQQQQQQQTQPKVSPQTESAQTVSISDPPQTSQQQSKLQPQQNSPKHNPQKQSPPQTSRLNQQLSPKLGHLPSSKPSHHSVTKPVQSQSQKQFKPPSPKQTLPQGQKTPQPSQKTLPGQSQKQGQGQGQQLVQSQLQKQNQPQQIQKQSQPQPQKLGQVHSQKSAQLHNQKLVPALTLKPGQPQSSKHGVLSSPKPGPSHGVAQQQARQAFPAQSSPGRPGQGSPQIINQGHKQTPNHFQSAGTTQTPGPSQVNQTAPKSPIQSPQQAILKVQSQSPTQGNSQPRNQNQSSTQPRNQTQSNAQPRNQTQTPTQTPAQSQAQVQMLAHNKMSTSSVTSSSQIAGKPQVKTPTPVQPTPSGNSNGNTNTNSVGHSPQPKVSQGHASSPTSAPTPVWPQKPNQPSERSPPATSAGATPTPPTSAPSQANHKQGSKIFAAPGRPLSQPPAPAATSTPAAPTAGPGTAAGPGPGPGTAATQGGQTQGRTPSPSVTNEQSRDHQRTVPVTTTHSTQSTPSQAQAQAQAKGQAKNEAPMPAHSQKNSADRRQQQDMHTQTAETHTQTESRENIEAEQDAPLDLHRPKVVEVRN